MSRHLMLDELDQQEYFATVLEDGHNGEYDSTTVSADAFMSVERAADSALGDRRFYVDWTWDESVLWNMRRWSIIGVDAKRMQVTR